MQPACIPLIAMEAKSENHGKVGPGWKPKGTVKKPGFLGGLSYHFDLATALYMLDGGEKFLIRIHEIRLSSSVC